MLTLLLQREKEAVVLVSLGNCKDCGKLHLATTSIYCKECMSKQAKLSQAIRSFLTSHPGATVMDVQREMGVPLRKVLEYQRG
ncbi:hypothetical protein ACFFK0_09670 [Paenibacillus chartarius]|uniref:Flagellar protein n=1 Tax=Paenibacillus chartarius TaxID=747481 RepID=A0ABV6DJG8_9BACL